MKTFALALGGGGARGLAHIVVVEALDEMGVKPNRPVAEDKLQGPPIERDHPLECALRGPIDSRLLLFWPVPQDACAHHGRERKGDHGRNDDSDAQGHGKLPEQAPDHVAHE